jgi:hypothetical protein
VVSTQSTTRYVTVIFFFFFLGHDAREGAKVALGGVTT